MGPRLLQGDAVLATFCLLSRQNTEPTSKLELLALATTKPFRCLPQHHTLYMWVFSELDCPLANARALGNADLYSQASFRTSCRYSSILSIGLLPMLR